MRRARLASFALSTATVVAAACGGGGDNGDGDAPADPDAAAVDAPGTAIDAPEVEVDAAEIDAALPGPVTVTVRSGGVPVAGVAVVWTDAAGAVLAHEATSTAGEATEDVYAGSAVTLLATSPTAAVSVTYLGIEPGDQLDWTFEPPPAVRHGDVSVTLAGAQPTATRYRIQLGCTRFETTTPAVAVTGVLPPACLGSDQTIDVVATAYNVQGAIVGYAVRTDVAAVAGGTTAVAMGAWQTNLDPLAIALTNVPTGTNGAHAVTFEHHFRADGVDFRGVDVSGLPSSANVTLQSGRFQGGIVERLQYVLMLGRGPQNMPVGYSALVVGRADAPAAVSHDLATLLPLVTAATSSQTGGRLQVDFTAAGSFATTDGSVFISRWRQGTVDHVAYVIAPPGVTSPVVVPPLPDALAAYRPTATSVFMRPTVIFAEADFIAGYRAFRAIASRLLATNGPIDVLPAAGGTMRLTFGGQLPQ